MNEKYQLFEKVFAGRTDAYGAGDGMCIKEIVSEKVIKAHLDGTKRLGRYPLSPEILEGSGTWWIVADIDDDDLGLAVQFCEPLGHLGISCYIERSKSKGYHVWVFFREPIKAAKARGLMNYAIEILEKDIGYWIYELFPKQDSIKNPDGTFGYGNYINLPLFGTDVEKGRTVFLNPQDRYQPYKNQWAFLRSIQRVSLEQIDDLIEQGEISLIEPKRPSIQRAKRRGEASSHSTPRSTEAEQLHPCKLLMTMMDKCAFCREFIPDTGTMHEELWYRWLTQMVCYEGGAELAFTLSSGSPKSDIETTRKKIAHAQDAVSKGRAPYTCVEIIDCMGWQSEECAECYSHPSKRNASPASLPIILQGLEREKERMISSTVVTSVTSTERATQVDDSDESEDDNDDRASLIMPFPTFPQIAWRGFFEDFRLAHSETTEAPDDFLFASMISATGAVLGRKGWMWYARPLYPNFYTCIVGVTARSRKTTAAEKASDLLKRCDPNVLYYRGLASAEGFISLFAMMSEKDEAEIDELIEKGELTFDEAPQKYRAQKARLTEGIAAYEGIRLLCYLPEFSALLKKAQRESSAGLTEAIIDAYDNPDKLDNPTRSSPLTASNPSCSIIAATTTSRLLRSLTKEETEGGFTNRFSYFIGNRKGPNDDPPEPDFERLNQVVQGIVVARRQWQNTRFQLLTSTHDLWKAYYEEWYYKNENTIIDPITGRLPDQVRKLSLQYAMLENNTPEILPEQMEAAIEVGRYWYECICALFKGYGLNEAQQTEQNILEAVANGGKSKKELYEHFSRNIDARTLNNALDNLQKVGRIAQEKKKTSGRGRPTSVFRLVENIKR